MTFFIAAIAGLLIGAVVVYFVLEKRRVEAQEWIKSAKKQIEEAQQVKATIDAVRQEREELSARIITIGELEQENRLLKRDMHNIGTTLRKMHLDHARIEETQRQIEARSNELAEEHLSLVETSVSQSINANNYALNKQRLVKAITWCREIGYEIQADREQRLLDELKADFETEVRKQVEREEQARIKAKIREDAAREREVQKELERIERERASIQAALNEALSKVRDQHSAEIELLKTKLADAESRQRSISQAEQTKAGYIYVVSNIGSFGEGVYKMGMTRRLDPMDRISELGDASVPFPFDVHMMISCTNAPSLETDLHRTFHNHRINKVNPRKEFFRLDIEEVRKYVESKHGKVEFVAAPTADQYRQSIVMTEEDHQYIERVYEQAEQAVGLAELED